MLLYVYGVIYTILYVMFCKMFIESFTKKRVLGKIYRFLILNGFIMIEYLQSIIFANIMLLKVIGIILCGTLFMWLYFEQKIIKIFILVLLYEGLCITTDYISLSMVGHFFIHVQREQLLSPAMNLLMGCLSQILLFFIILGIGRYFANNSASMLTELEWIRFTIFPVFTMGSIMAMLADFDTTVSIRQKDVLLYIAFGMLIINVLVFYLIHDILEREKQIREDKLFRERVKNETRMYHQISANYDMQCKREHEYKNQIMVISALVQKRKLEDLDRYLNKACDEIEHKTDCIDTNNVIVNAILNTKYREAKQKDVVFVLKVNDLSNLPITDEDVVVILSNLLNNALEACEKCNDKILKIKFIKENEQIVISVVNSFDGNILVVNGNYCSSKDDLSIHGMGIKNVKEVVGKYGGTCVVRHDNYMFHFIIFI